MSRDRETCLIRANEAVMLDDRNWQSARRGGAMNQTKITNGIGWTSMATPCDAPVLAVA